MKSSHTASSRRPVLAELNTSEPDEALINEASLKCFCNRLTWNQSSSVKNEAALFGSPATFVWVGPTLVHWQRFCLLLSQGFDCTEEAFSTQSFLHNLCKHAIITEVQKERDNRKVAWVLFGLQWKTHMRLMKKCWYLSPLLSVEDGVHVGTFIGAGVTSGTAVYISVWFIWGMNCNKWTCGQSKWFKPW